MQDLYENFITAVSRDKDVGNKFRNLSGSAVHPDPDTQHISPVTVQLTLLAC